MNETQEKQRETDELVQLLMAVLLIAFAVIAAAFLMAAHVSSVFGR